MAFLFQLIGIIFVLIIAFAPGLIEKPCPPGYELDILKSALDLSSGISKWEYIRRKNRGDYWITHEEFEIKMGLRPPKEVLPNIADIDRYNFEKTQIDPTELDWRVKAGKYRYIVKDKSKWIDCGK